MRRTRRCAAFFLLVLLFVPLALAAEEAPSAEPVYGNPDCPVCHGTGKVTPQSLRRGKSAKKQVVMYCYYKASGKRSPILIGGWEPCSRCADLPTMAPINREHDGVVAWYEEHDHSYDFLRRETKLRLNYAEGVHFRLLSDCPHGCFHGSIEALEAAWDIFAYEWGLLKKDYLAQQPICFEEPWNVEEEGGEEPEGEDDFVFAEPDEGLAWDRRWRDSPMTVYMLNSRDEYEKFIDWYWENGGGTKDMGGKALLKRCSAIGVSGRLPWGRLTYWKDATTTHCGLVHFAGHKFLEEACGGGKLPHWLNEGFAKYMEYRVKGVTVTHCIKYGTGQKMDTDWQDSGAWKKRLKAAAGVKSGFDRRKGRWVGLIPMEIMEKYRIENISWQGMAQSWGLVCFLMGDGLRASRRKAWTKKFRKLAAGIAARGIEPEAQEEVIKEVYGMTGAQLFEKWRTWLRRKW